MLNNKKVYAGIVGYTNRDGFGKLLKDSDGDKVPNVFDCDPDNPKKQGFIHDVKKRLKERAAEKKQISAAERDIKKKALAESLRTRRDEEIQTARFKEQQRAKQQRAKIAKGGSSFNFGSALSYLSGTPTTKKQLPSRSTIKKMPSRSKIVKTTKYVKGKGGLLKKVSGYKRVKVRSRSTIKKMPSKSKWDNLNSMI